MSTSNTLGDSFSSVADLAKAVRSRQVSAVEVTRRQLDRIAKLDAALGCFLAVDERGALAAAQAVDDQVRAGGGDDLLLAGVPIGIKDMICTEGLATTAGSKILSGFVPPYDATVVAKPAPPVR